MGIIEKILGGLLERGLTWLANIIIVWVKLKAKISQRNKEIEKKVVKHEALVAKLKEKKGPITDGDKKKLIDSARSIIRG